MGLAKTIEKIAARSSSVVEMRRILYFVPGENSETCSGRDVRGDSEECAVECVGRGRGTCKDFQKSRRKTEDMFKSVILIIANSAPDNCTYETMIPSLNPVQPPKVHKCARLPRGLPQGTNLTFPTYRGSMEQVCY